MLSFRNNFTYDCDNEDINCDPVGNQCFNYTVNGDTGSACCCSTDLCNVGATVSLNQLATLLITLFISVAVLLLYSL